MKRARLVPAAAVVIASGACAALRATPTALDLRQSWAPPSVLHPLGCGEAGVDLLALVGHATVRGVGLAAVVAVAGMVIGAPLGAAAALARGRWERGVARACDLVQSIPTFLLALSVLSVVRAPSRVHLAAVFVLTAWAPFARLSLAEGRVLRAASFVEAARALGADRLTVLARHVLPNTVGVVAVQLGATAAAVVVSEAALAFVGFGVQGGVSLGAILDQGVASMLRAPHVLLVGAGAVFVTSASLMAAGRALDEPGARR